ncbi:hypothetical protein BC937DRAFT_92304 [Endogone sp. FLAS-F59071]|nr:hypothetical protein BC937DRAFT_92304 [Endogone sp. FLAS-F59071]|eukprot:RUS15563.1 hypothetical protein BC937DRAFT_92304 [Endogone sp. FLAS-F59071]
MWDGSDTSRFDHLIRQEAIYLQDRCVPASRIDSRGKFRAAMKPCCLGNKILAGSPLLSH